MHEGVGNGWLEVIEEQPSLAPERSRRAEGCQYRSKTARNWVQFPASPAFAADAVTARRLCAGFLTW